MPIPDFVVALRRAVGDAELWLIGVTAVVVHDGRLLLVRRSDTGEWAPITGIVDPGEEPAVCARREAKEEACVDIRVDRLASISTTPVITHANGDRARYLDHTFACGWLGGDARVGDEESTDVRWWPLDDLPPMSERMRTRVRDALEGGPEARFVGGG